MDQATTLASDESEEIPSGPPQHDSDPIIASILITLTFAALAAIRLTIPSAPYFDEVHYIPAAREMLEGGIYRNQEHPLLGKELIAMGIVIFGDSAFGWRVMPWLAGTLALFAGMRAMWFATESRFSSLAFGVLLASGFILFVQSRIAMLDIFMMSALSVAAWQFAAAIREPEKGRTRLILCGIALGAAISSKWNAIPLATLPGLAFLAARIAADRRRPLFSKRGIPVPGVSLFEAGVWLGLVPVSLYLTSFLPAWNLQDSPLPSLGLAGMQEHMLGLQTQTLNPHPYESTLAEWLINWRAIWYLYDPVDGAQRGVMLIGNPLTMLLGLPALIWCTVSGFTERNWTKLAIIVGFVTSIGLWVFAEKSVQYYYHYFVPSCFLLAALTLALDALWQSGRRKIASAILLASVALFAWFYPILSAAPLEDRSSFATWTWLASWT